ncbi:hypothetical protein A3A07_00890 [Candidatus Nomurabacteria bacterium RIFCSPLOWO2_01_FULL_41_52]|nr:MAG: hypothetical protein A3A07_00890 [Candidatus Nomurabacteria bacterium RIFCSPLOWO2_01_FULL_41_52]
MDPFRPGLECYKGGLSLGVWGSKIKEYMKMGMGMGPRQSLRQEQKLTQTQILEQRISARLLIELRQDVGKFEKQILKKVEFVGIDPEEPESQYHYEVLGTLVLRASEDRESLLGQIVRENYIDIEDVQKVMVESFELQDIDLDLGTKRNVDLITLVLKDEKEFSVTVSIDKHATHDIHQSPSFQESQALSNIDTGKAWAVQRFLGYKTIEDSVDGKFKGLICKEFIPGEVLGNVTADIELSKETHGEAAMKKLAYAVGKMFANCLNEFGGVPRDSNSLNIIIVNSNLENPVTRFCDVEEVRRDEAGIKLELRLMVAEFEEFGNEVTRGIKDNLSEELKAVYP